jgi:shikimate 5-dehydrogenase
MGGPYAEVIGDPIAQSKSPLIHRRWLEQLGLEGDYRAALVGADGLAGYLADRRQDPDWRGSNVTIPHKQKVIALLDCIEPGAKAIGAVNCISPEGGILVGRNTDIEGVAAALGGTSLHGRKAALIGAGGGARAAFRYFVEQGVENIAIVVRDPARAAAFIEEAEGARVEIHPIDACEPAFAGAAAIVNAARSAWRDRRSCPLACSKRWRRTPEARHYSTWSTSRCGPTFSLRAKRRGARPSMGW